MSKLEEKLIELGYVKDRKIGKYTKKIRYYNLVIIIAFKEIADFYIDINITIDNQYEIDSLQQAFNQLKKDLEVLRKYEEKD